MAARIERQTGYLESAFGPIEQFDEYRAGFEQLGATFEEVTDWEMPAHYGDWRAEYQAVRQAVGVADLSHRGKVRVTGDDRVKWLQSVIRNDILPLQSGQGRYARRPARLAPGTTPEAVPHTPAIPCTGAPRP